MKLLFYIIIFSVFYSCSSENKGTKEVVLLLSDAQINKLVSQTFDSLSKALNQAISEGGFEEAIEFCNLKAIYITQQNGDDKISINRRSNRFRNAENKADSIALQAIQQFMEISSEKWPETILNFEQESEFRYYKPIALMPQCLPCHGSLGVSIPESVAAKITEKYPNDLATGFDIGNLRGVWEIIQKK